MPEWGRIFQVSHCKGSHFSLSVLYFLEGSRCVQPTHKEGKLCFTCLRRKYLHKLFGTLLDRRPIFALPLIGSIVYLYKYRMDIYLILWVIIQYYFTYFDAQIVSVLVIGSSFSRLLCPFNNPINIVCFVLLFWALPYFLAQEDAPNLFKIFPAQS